MTGLLPLKTTCRYGLMSVRNGSVSLICIGGLGETIVLCKAEVIMG